MKTSLVKSLVMALFITGGLSTQVSGQKGCCGGNCCGVSDLKDDQKTKIETLCTENAKKNLAFDNQLQEKMAQFKTLMTADKADMAAINKLIDEIGKIKTEKMKAHAAHKQEIRKILDDKQRLEFDLHLSKQGFCGGQGHHGNDIKGKSCHDGHYGHQHKSDAGCHGHQHGKGLYKCNDQNLPKINNAKIE